MLVHYVHCARLCRGSVYLVELLRGLNAEVVVAQLCLDLAAEDRAALHLFQKRQRLRMRLPPPRQNAFAQPLAKGSVLSLEDNGGSDKNNASRPTSARPRTTLRGLPEISQESSLRRLMMSF